MAEKAVQEYSFLIYLPNKNITVMQRTAAILSVFFLIAVPVLSNAQAFSKDDPIGAQQVFVTKTAEGWVSETTTYKITGKQESAGRTTMTIAAHISAREAEDSVPLETDASLKIIYTPNSIIFPKENFTSNAGMIEKELDGHKVEMKFSGDDPSTPLAPKVGDKLPDVEIKADFNIEGVKAKMTLKSSDRRISGQERITVPAGSFDTFVLEETSTAKITILVLSQSEKTIEKSWLVPGRGDVKSMTYDKKGKLVSTEEMISYKK